MILDEDCNLRLRYMEHPFGTEDGSHNEGRYETHRIKVVIIRAKSWLGKLSSAIAALALAYGRACCCESIPDDLLAVIMRHLTAGKCLYPVIRYLGAFKF